MLAVKAQGGDVRIVYSPLDAVKLAEQNPAKEVVFFGVGFETTAPANAMAVWQAKRLGLKNFSILCSHVLVPPAMEVILSSASNRVQGFLAVGHVCTVMGYTEYEPISARYRVPIVVTGFEPLDILQGILMVVQQLEQGRAEVENQYSRTVSQEGTVSIGKARTLGIDIVSLDKQLRKWASLLAVAGTITLFAFDAGQRDHLHVLGIDLRFRRDDLQFQRVGHCLRSWTVESWRPSAEHPLGDSLRLLLLLRLLPLENQQHVHQQRLVVRLHLRRWHHPRQRRAAVGVHPDHRRDGGQGL